MEHIDDNGPESRSIDDVSVDQDIGFDDTTPAGGLTLIGERGWRRMVCDLVQYTYEQVTKLRVEHFQLYPRENAKGEMVMVGPAGRIRTTREALVSASWFASSDCVMFCDAVGFHPSHLWTQPDWRAAVGRLLGLLDAWEMHGHYPPNRRRLVEECLAQHGKVGRRYARADV